MVEPAKNFLAASPARAAALAKLGIETLEDFLHFRPIGYQDWRHISQIADAQIGQIITWRAKLISLKPVFTGRRPFVTGIIEDASGRAMIYWFNGLHFLKSFTVDQEYIWHGTVREMRGKKVLIHPNSEIADKKGGRAGHLAPVYPKVKGFPGITWAKNWEKFAANTQEIIPWPESVKAAVKRHLGQTFDDLIEVYKILHHPQSDEQVNLATKTLTLLEITSHKIWLLNSKIIQAKPFKITDKKYQEIIQALPFVLTDDQKRACDTIREELAQAVAMRRLLQGDVGSGKTVVAAIAAAIVCQAGGSVAFLSPTRLLSEQHFETLNKLWSKKNLGEIKLVIGGKKLIPQTKNQPSIFVGTTAILEQDLKYDLAIVDEQHRFGVKQRAALEQIRPDNSEPKAHFLSMTATPIPRTVALAALGHVAYSTIHQKPGNRPEIKTKIISDVEQEEKTWDWCRKQIKVGHRIYIVCPAIESLEESTKEVDYQSAESVYSWVKAGPFKNFKVGLLHGQQKKADQDKTMSAFKTGEISVLVATTVIEVGIDVPEATVMIILAAERFGLATLHQLRGRVGRSDKPSICLLRPSVLNSQIERLNIVVNTTDGQELADKDFALRGGGSLFGTAQSGPAQEFSFPQQISSDLIELSDAIASAQDLSPKEKNWWQNFYRRQEIRHLE